VVQTPEEEGNLVPDQKGQAPLQIRCAAQGPLVLLDLPFEVDTLEEASSMRLDCPELLIGSGPTMTACLSSGFA